LFLDRGPLLCHCWGKHDRKPYRVSCVVEFHSNFFEQREDGFRAKRLTLEVNRLAMVIKGLAEGIMHVLTHLPSHLLCKRFHSL